ncbi:LysR family transcriptional regulator [Acuticoccus sp. MNP-M23]|uniref:LysR family transcriptional regulator n=1 Tax=Acuticoccus sp. MNP-M23 TaxID=3072793 RepID=UPI0028160697|nr:LysR family transcriptional regulator [Acuticoccus sp. MNP-M23]WMS42660.1 LysR family transcriptional regulator [Acuticoccus sp. MNP-M23]
MPLDWNDLKIALALSRSGSLSGGGRALGLDQSTVGRRLTALEAAVGATLFVRTRAGVAVTEAGQRLIDLAMEVESRVGQLSEVVGESERGASGAVRIDGVQWVLDRLLAVGLKTLVDDNPGLTLRVFGVERSPDVWPGEPCVGLWFEQAPRGGAFGIKLGGVDHAVYGRRGGSANGTAALTGGQGAVPFAGGASAGPGQPRLVVNALSALLSALCEGQSNVTAILPVCLGDNRRELVRLSGPGETVVRDLYLHVHPDTIGSARVQAIVRWLRAVFPSAF